MPRNLSDIIKMAGTEFSVLQNLVLQSPDGYTSSLESLIMSATRAKDLLLEASNLAPDIFLIKFALLGTYLSLASQYVEKGEEEKACEYWKLIIDSATTKFPTAVQFAKENADPKLEPISIVGHPGFSTINNVGRYFVLCVAQASIGLADAAMRNGELDEANQRYKVSEDGYRLLIKHADGLFSLAASLGLSILLQEQGRPAEFT